MESSIVSVNVAQPRIVEWQGEPISTGIFKTATDGPVPVSFLNLAGDRQADLSVHGGPDKAVYAYPIEHYAFWRGTYAGRAFAFGEFGENPTTE